MPTVLRQNGYSLMIYTRDHEPMHVHVWYQGNEAIIRFETDIILLEEQGFNRREIRQALTIVNKNREFLIEKWRDIYG
jgi:Domain of unknown function (DUF4160)